MQMTTQPPYVQDVLDHFDGVKPTSQGWQARCPAHDDRHASLHIATGEGGRILLHCHAGCSYDAVREAAGLSRADMYPPDYQTNDAGSRRIEATYDYRDADGNLLYQVVRFEPKSFRQRRPDGNGSWVWRLDDTPRVLYRLAEILNADEGAWVFVVEGEKDADNLAALDLVATTCPQGAEAWDRLSDDSALEGRRIAIIPDADKPGRKHAIHIASRLHGRAQTVKVIELPDKDASDWLDAGGTVDELLQMAEQAPEWTPPKRTPSHRADSHAADKSPQEADETLLSDCTDAGNAEILAKLYGDKIRYNHVRGRWYVWCGYYWAEDADGAVVRMLLDCARWRAKHAYDLPDPERAKDAFKWAVSSRQNTKLQAALSVARNIPPLNDSGKDWDARPHLLACQNATLEFKRDRAAVRPGRQNDRLTHAVPVDYRLNAQCPRWQRFLREILPDDDVRGFVRRALGYSIIGSTREQCFFLLSGRGANGKSTLLGTIAHVLGPLAMTTPFQTFLVQYGAAATNDLASLSGRRFVTASETRDGTRLDEGRVKALTGGDEISARFLYGEYFQFTPQMKLWLGVNHRPIVNDNSIAFWRRARVIEFSQQFDPKAEPDLPRKLRAEAPGIFAWLVRAATEYLREGLGEPEAVRLAVANYRRESDVLGDFFDECCVFGEYEAAFRDIYAAYKKWAEDQGMGRRETLSRQKFGRKLGEKHRKYYPSRGAPVRYVGIGLRGEVLL